MITVLAGTGVAVSVTAAGALAPCVAAGAVDPEVLAAAVPQPASAARARRNPAAVSEAVLRFIRCVLSVIARRNSCGCRYSIGWMVRMGPPRQSPIRRGPPTW